MIDESTAITLRDGFLAETNVSEIEALCDWVTVVQALPLGCSENDFSAAVTLVADRLGRASQSGEIMRVPIFGMGGETGRQFYMARIGEFERGTFVGVHRLADLPTAWPGSAPAMGPRSIVSIVMRCMRAADRSGNAPAIGLAIAEQLDHEVTKLLDEQMDWIVAMVADAALADGIHAASERLASFKALLETRVRVQRARTMVRREGVEDATVAELDAVIDGLDSAASALAGMVSTVLAEAFAKADTAERARDRRITLGGTAVLLPALLFGLLGVNWIPTDGLQQWWVFFVVVAGGLLLGCAGWWLGRLLLRVSRRSESGGNRDK